MKVFRFEHPSDGFGGYQDGNFHLDQIRMTFREIHGSYSDEVHPCPSYDGIDGIQCYERCGFESLWDLNAWFTQEEQASLFEAGFELLAYEIPMDFVRFGRKQVVFDYNEILDIEVLSL